MTRVVVLGGGPAGVGAALRLREERKADVVVLERGGAVGGNAGSFEWNGHRLDFGSHRLHPSCKPRILDDIRRLLGDDLLDRPRHGRIRLLGRWVHFPLRPADLVLHAPPSFVLRSGIDAVTKPFRGRAAGEESFASVLEASLGPTICKDFYFPYARKIWGAEPSALAATQARRRVSASSPLKLVKKILTQVPGFKPPGAGRFFYPRGGFGRIAEAYADEARRLGADIRLGHAVTRIERPRSADSPWRIHARHAAGDVQFEADHVWSTIPVTLLARMLWPAPPADVVAASGGISYRAMALVYLEVDAEQFTEYDAHYFPAADVKITRLSEPRNYGLVKVPAGRTVLCAELPCAVGDDVWSAKDEDLGRVLAADLAHSGIPLPRAARAVHVARLPQAYPIYMTGYEPALEALDGFVSGIDRLLSYGRQGLFAHDNTHHALAMAYAAVECLRDGRFDAAPWQEHRREFATHVVED